MNDKKELDYYTDGKIEGGCNLLIPVKNKDSTEIIQDYLNIYDKVLFCSQYFKPHRIEGVNKGDPNYLITEKEDITLDEIENAIRNHLKNKPLEYYRIKVDMDGQFLIFDKSGSFTEKWIPFVCSLFIKRYTLRPEIHYPWQQKELNELTERHWIREFGNEWQTVLQDNRPGKIDFDLFYSLAFWTISDIWQSFRYYEGSKQLYKTNVNRLWEFFHKIEDNVSAKFIDCDGQLVEIYKYSKSE